MARDTDAPTGRMEIKGIDDSGVPEASAHQRAGRVAFLERGHRFVSKTWNGPRRVNLWSPVRVHLIRVAWWAGWSKNEIASALHVVTGMVTSQHAVRHKLQHLGLLSPGWRAALDEQLRAAHPNGELPSVKPSAEDFVGLAELVPGLERDALRLRRHLIEMLTPAQIVVLEGESWTRRQRLHDWLKRRGLTPNRKQRTPPAAPRAAAHASAAPSTPSPSGDPAPPPVATVPPRAITEG